MSCSRTQCSAIGEVLEDFIFFYCSELQKKSVRFYQISQNFMPLSRVGVILFLHGFKGILFSSLVTCVKGQNFKNPEL